jgi:hypothetical protein
VNHRQVAFHLLWVAIDGKPIMGIADLPQGRSDPVLHPVPGRPTTRHQT